MSNLSNFKHKGTLWMITALILVIMAILFGSFAWQARAQAPEPETPAMPMNAPDSFSGPFLCTIRYLTVYTDLFHVKCLDPLPSTSIYWFAYPTDSANGLIANRMLTLINTAYALGKPINVYYDSDSAQNPPGCNVTACRLLLGLFVEP